MVATAADKICCSGTYPDCLFSGELSASRALGTFSSRPSGAHTAGLAVLGAHNSHLISANQQCVLQNNFQSQKKKIATEIFRIWWVHLISFPIGEKNGHFIRADHQIERRDLGVLASFRSFPTFTDLCLRGKQFQNFEL
jgi:hypothetical protein